MTQLFISDLHLDASRPEAIELFTELLKGEARQAERLYILGDLFETWIGDDLPGKVGLRVIDALQSLHRDNVPCYFIGGNRDFMIRSRFATAAGMHLLPEFALTNINGERVLLLHGDLLCTDDPGYLRYRKFVHTPLFQRLFLALPASVRQRISDNLRSKSASESSRKPPEIMDVSQAAVEMVMRRYEVKTMIHGHTHRPAIHCFELDGADARRIVLGDWYEQGSILRCDDNGFQLDQLSISVG
jgi:UDP-2,3-diacylglucosamine hydrolase